MYEKTLMGFFFFFFFLEIRQNLSAILSFEDGYWWGWVVESKENKQMCDFII